MFLKILSHFLEKYPLSKSHYKLFFLPLFEDIVLRSLSHFYRILVFENVPNLNIRNICLIGGLFVINELLADKECVCPKSSTQYI